MFFFLVSVARSHVEHAVNIWESFGQEPYFLTTQCGSI